MDKPFKGEITFRSHSVTVELLDDRIYCFKHNDISCEMKIFENVDEMVEWSIEPFPTIRYNLILDQED